MAIFQSLSSSFLVVSSAIGKMLLLILLGFFLYRQKILKSTSSDFLSFSLIRVFFPILIFVKIVKNFSYSAYPNWWHLPLISMGYNIVAMLVGLIVFKLFFKKDKGEEEFICSSGFQNAGYLVLTLIFFMFDNGPFRDDIFVNVFLFLVGFNVLIWSLIPIFLGYKNNMKKINIQFILNPPVIATVVALVLVAFFGKGCIQDYAMKPLSLVASLSFPISMITLGCYLCKFSGFKPESPLKVISLCLVKLVAFPLMVFGLLFVFEMSPALRFVLFLEGIMPAAVSLVVIGFLTGANTKFFSSAVLYSHLISIITIPVWLEVYFYFFGFPVK